jgi:predicted TIM-barrel fold metal-dependent hydrolase
MDIPIQCHTGHVEPLSANMLTQQLHFCDPSFIAPFARKHPHARIVLLHTGFPYQNEYLSIVKNTPNLFADFSWVYMISPTLAGQTLKMAVDMIPSSKIIGFGGDCCQMEALYAHCMMARKVLTSAFSEMTQDGTLTLDAAETFLSQILFENPKRIYQL